MKPASIKKFDLLWLGSVVVGLIGIVLGWDLLMSQMGTELAAQADAQGIDAADAGSLAFGTAIVVIAISVGLSLLLWALISVWRIEFVKWLIGLLAVYGVVSALIGLGVGANLLTISGLISALMGIAAVYFLFRPDAKAWFDEK